MFLRMMAGHMMDHVRQGAEAIVKQGTHVRIDEARLSSLAAGLRSVPTPAWDTEMHFFDGTPKSIMYTLLLDAVNFCFWPSEFTVDYKGKSYGKEDGYCALAVAVKRAFETGGPLWDASFLSTLDETAWSDVFAGGGQVPLMKERLANARNIGRVLTEKFGGDPSALVAAAEGSAPKLALLLAEHFDAYKDERDYKGTQYAILKRAQLCVSDLVGSFATQGSLGLKDAEDLTCFADYKLPQLFHCRGAFVYAPELEAKIMTGELIPENSEEEVEIRANTIVAVEKMKDVMAAAGRVISARELDWLLWNEGVFGAPLDKPHHRTITTSY